MLHNISHDAACVDSSILHECIKVFGFDIVSKMFSISSSNIVVIGKISYSLSPKLKEPEKIKLIYWDTELFLIHLVLK